MLSMTKLISPTLKRSSTFHFTKIQSRSIYDLKAQKVAYKENKRLEYKQNHPENVEIAVAMDVFNTYTLGLDLPLSLQIELSDSAVGGTGKTIKGEVSFPHQVKEETKMSVLIFATGKEAILAKELGATIVGGEELITQLSDPTYFSSIKVDKVLCTVAMFPKVVKIAKILGPAGLMPSPSKGTVSDDLESMLQSLQSSTLYESDSDKCVHIEVARTNWDQYRIQDNFNAILKSIERSAKGSSDAVVGIQMSASPFTPGIRMPFKKLIEQANEKKKMNKL